MSIPTPKKRSGILTKMVIFMLFIALVPLIVAAISIKTFNDLHQNEIEDRQNEVVSQINRGFESEFARLQADLKAAAASGLSLTATAKTTTGIELLTVVDMKSGTVISRYSPLYTAPAEAGSDIPVTSPLFVRAAKGESALGPLRTTPSGPHVTLAIPFEGKILFAGVNVSDMFRRVIAENKNSAAGFTFVTDHEGRLLMKDNEIAEAPVSLRGSPLVGTLLYRNNIKTEGQTRYVNYWHQSVVGYGSIHSLPGMLAPIGVFVELPVSEADFILGQLIERFSFITLLLVILTFSLSFYLTLTLVRPIRELELATERTAQGKFDEPVKIQSGDEFEELGGAFNGMMKGLKELAELREEFVFVAAHELRAPVGIIKGYLSLLLDNVNGALAPTVRTQLVKIKGANERLVQLIEDLLEVSREESGRLEIKVEPVDIKEPIQKVVADAEKLASDKSITLTYKPSAATKVLADSNRIGEIVMNLVSNAIKYSPEKSKVTITHEQKGSMLFTYVEDNGFGMSEEAQKKLFEKFYRVKTDKTKDIQGTGLGLFIVRKIVEKMGGTIGVTSAEGKGSKFNFSLPVAK